MITLKQWIEYFILCCMWLMGKLCQVPSSRVNLKWEGVVVKPNVKFEFKCHFEKSGYGIKGLQYPDQNENFFKLTSTRFDIYHICPPGYEQVLVTINTIKWLIKIV